MEQIRLLIEKTLAGITPDPTKIAEYVTRDDKQVISVDVSDKFTLLLALRDGTPEEQTPVKDQPYRQYVKEFNDTGKVVLGMVALYDDGDGGKYLSYFWRSSPSVSILLFSVALRTWKKVVRLPEREDAGTSALLTRLARSSDPAMTVVSDASAVDIEKDLTTLSMPVLTDMFAQQTAAAETVKAVKNQFDEIFMKMRSANSEGRRRPLHALRDALSEKHDVFGRLFGRRIPE